MQRTQLGTTDKPSSTEKAEQATAVFRDATIRRRVGIKMVQNVLLIWLDHNIDDNSEDCRNTVSQLRRVVNMVYTFTDGDNCVKFLKTLNNETVCMIISDSLGQQIVPEVHTMSVIDSIFITCDGKEHYESWTKEWFKIKGTFTEIASVCEALKQASRQCEQNSISISFVATNDDAFNKNLDRLDPMYLYTQVTKEILLTIEFEQHHLNEFVEYCRNAFDKDNHRLMIVDKLEREYRDKTPTWWYTYDAFLYPMLNRALRTSDMDIIIKMGFFITDLHRHIEKLHREQFDGYKIDEILKVYRGQGLSKADFDQLMNTRNGLMSFNNFLSTSKDHAVSLAFAESNQSNPNLVGILFVITIEPSKSTIPFASIIGVSQFQVEDEVLFSMHTVFRIHDIKSIDETQRLFQVDLTLTDDNDKDLHILTDYIREEVFPTQNGWSKLSLLLIMMGQSDQALQIYQVLLDQATNESGKAKIYHQMGCAKQSQGEYKEAIIFFEQSLDIMKETHSEDSSELSSLYNNLGLAYYSMKEYSKALSYHEKALEIRQLSLPPNDPSVANSYNNIGMVYGDMDDHSKALLYYEKALEIKQQFLPSNHPDLAKFYNNIGEMCRRMGEYSKALSSHEKALEIRQRSLLPNHPDLAISYNNIGVIYKHMGEYSKALPSHEKALEIQQQLLPPSHPNLASFYNNIGLLYHEMGEYSKALSSYEEVLKIQQQVLPPSHPNLAIFYKKIGLIYCETGEYSKALSSYEKALEIQQQLLPPNHLKLTASYNDIGTMHFKMGECSKALSYYEKTLEILQNALSPNHPNLAGVYNNVGLVHNSMGEYSKAFWYHERALEIIQQSSSPNQQNLADFYINIGMVHFNRKEYSEALSYYEKALRIREQSLPPNHPNLFSSYNNIGSSYAEMGMLTEALVYFEKAHEIIQKSHPNHPDLAMSCSNIGSIHEGLRDYSKASSFYERAVDIGQHSLPSDHSMMQQWRNKLENVKKKL